MIYEQTYTHARTPGTALASIRRGPWFRAQVVESRRVARFKIPKNECTHTLALPIPMEHIRIFTTERAPASVQTHTHKRIGLLQADEKTESRKVFCTYIFFPCFANLRTGFYFTESREHTHTHKRTPCYYAQLLVFWECWCAGLERLGVVGKDVGICKYWHRCTHKRVSID